MALRQGLDLRWQEWLAGGSRKARLSEDLTVEAVALLRAGR